jgi:hypothetical protein
MSVCMDMDILLYIRDRHGKVVKMFVSNYTLTFGLLPSSCAGSLPPGTEPRIVC